MPGTRVAVCACAALGQPRALDFISFVDFFGCCGGLGSFSSFLYLALVFKHTGRGVRCAEIWTVPGGRCGIVIRGALGCSEVGVQRKLTFSW